MKQLLATFLAISLLLQPTVPVWAMTQPLCEGEDCSAPTTVSPFTNIPENPIPTNVNLPAENSEVVETPISVPDPMPAIVQTVEEESSIASLQTSLERLRQKLNQDDLELDEEMQVILQRTTVDFEEGIRPPLKDDEVNDQAFFGDEEERALQIALQTFDLLSHGFLQMLQNPPDSGNKHDIYTFFTRLVDLGKAIIRSQHSTLNHGLQIHRQLDVQLGYVLALSGTKIENLTEATHSIWHLLSFRHRFFERFWSAGLTPDQILGLITRTHQDYRNFSEAHERLVHDDNVEPGNLPPAASVYFDFMQTISFAMSAFRHGFEDQNAMNQIQTMVIEETQEIVRRLIQKRDALSLGLVLKGLREAARSSIVFGERQRIFQDFLKTTLFTVLNQIAQRENNENDSWNASDISSSFQGVFDTVTYLIESGVTNDMDNMALLNSLFDIFNHEKQIFNRALTEEGAVDPNAIFFDNPFLELMSNLIEVSNLIFQRLQSQGDVSQELKTRFASEMANRLWQAYRTLGTFFPLRVGNAMLSTGENESNETWEMRRDLRRVLRHLQNLLGDADPPLWTQIGKVIEIANLPFYRIPGDIWTQDLMAIRNQPTSPPAPFFGPHLMDHRVNPNLPVPPPPVIPENHVTLNEIRVNLGLAAPSEDTLHILHQVMENGEFHEGTSSLVLDQMVHETENEVAVSLHNPETLALYEFTVVYPSNPNGEIGIFQYEIDGSENLISGPITTSTESPSHISDENIVQPNEQLPTDVQTDEEEPKEMPQPVADDEPTSAVEPSAEEREIDLMIDAIRQMLENSSRAVKEKVEAELQRIRMAIPQPYRVSQLSALQKFVAAVQGHISQKDAVKEYIQAVERQWQNDEQHAIEQMGSDRPDTGNLPDVTRGNYLIALAASYRLFSLTSLSLDSDLWELRSMQSELGDEINELGPEHNGASQRLQDIRIQITRLESESARAQEMTNFIIEEIFNLDQETSNSEDPLPKLDLHDLEQLRIMLNALREVLANEFDEEIRNRAIQNFEREFNRVKTILQQRENNMMHIMIELAPAYEAFLYPFAGRREDLEDQEDELMRQINGPNPTMSPTTLVALQRQLDTLRQELGKINYLDHRYMKWRDGGNAIERISIDIFEERLQKLRMEFNRLLGRPPIDPPGPQPQIPVAPLLVVPNENPPVPDPNETPPSPLILAPADNSNNEDTASNENPKHGEFVSAPNNGEEAEVPETGEENEEPASEGDSEETTEETTQPNQPQPPVEPTPEQRQIELMTTKIRQLSEGLSRPMVEDYIEAEIYRIFAEVPQEHRASELSALQQFVMALLGQISPADAVDESIQAKKRQPENDEALAEVFRELQELENKISEELSEHMERGEETMDELELETDEEKRADLRRLLKNSEEQIFRLRNEYFQILQMQNHLEKMILALDPQLAPAYPSIERLKEILENPEIGQQKKDSAIEAFEEELNRIGQSLEDRSERRLTLLSQKFQLGQSLQQLNNDPEAREAIEYQIRAIDAEMSQMVSELIELILFQIIEDRLMQLREDLDRLLGRDMPPAPPEEEEEAPAIVSVPPAGDPPATASVSPTTPNYYPYVSPLASTASQTYPTSIGNDTLHENQRGSYAYLQAQGAPQEAPIEDPMKDAATNLAVETGATNPRNLADINTSAPRPVPLTSFDLMITSPLLLEERLAALSGAQLLQIIQDPFALSNPVFLAVLERLLMNPQIASDLRAQITEALAMAKDEAI